MIAKFNSKSMNSDIQGFDLPKTAKNAVSRRHYDSVAREMPKKDIVSVQIHQYTAERTVTINYY